MALAAFVGFVAAFGFAAAVLALDAEPPVTLFLAGARFAVVAGFLTAVPTGVAFFTAGFAGAFLADTDGFAGTFFAAVALVVVAAEDFDFVAVGFVRELAAEDFGVGLAFDLATTFVGGFAAGFATGFVAGLFSLAAVDSAGLFGASLTFPERPLGSAKTPLSAPCEIALFS